jgi:peptidoglycan lytic transglycosylase G
VSVRRGAGPRDPMAHPSDSSTPRPVTQRQGGDRDGGFGGGYGRAPRDRYRYPDERRGGHGSVLRFLIFLAVMAGLVLAVLFTVARPIARTVVAGFAEDNPSALKVGFIADLVAEDIGPALTAKASDDDTEVDFVVGSGDTPATLAPRLLDEKVITSERAFLFQSTMDELTPKLAAGHFLLRLDMTPQEVVKGLVENRIVVRTIDIRFREGLRIEQMAAQLSTIDGTLIDPAEFLEITKTPPPELLDEFPWLKDPKIHPEGASLEGFLYPATYTVRVGQDDPDDAGSLVRMMLRAFQDRVTEKMRDVPAARKLDFYQVLTLASIVEREAVLDDERALIAGVYQNRIDGKPGVKHKLLQADPTILYANDTVKLGEYSDAWKQYLFWAPKNVDIKKYADIEFPAALAGYNTYRVKGLPPGPICTPTVKSIEAALAPNTKAGMNYFVAIPDDSGRHDFSKTEAEHRQKLQQYGY